MAARDEPGFLLVAGMVLSMVLTGYTLGNGSTLVFAGMSQGAPAGDIMVILLSVLTMTQAGMIWFARRTPIKTP